MNPAPPKPPSKNADRKALAAYWSELRRWAKALADWEADLDEREAAFEDYDDEDCGCTIEDAKAGCECPTCMDWRDFRRPGPDELDGDGVKWLEDLWKLEDKRK